VGAGAGADFFTTAFLTGAAFFPFFADGAFTATFFTAAFLEATFFAGTDFAAALCKRQRFFAAAMILFMPSALPACRFWRCRREWRQRLNLILDFGPPCFLCKGHLPSGRCADFLALAGRRFRRRG
jgi:hypothetical protein